jgi:signal transduction histidine kinase
MMGMLTLHFIQLTIDREQRRNMMRMAEDIASQAAERGGRIPEGAAQARWLNELLHKHRLQKGVIVFLWNRDGLVTQQFPPTPPEDTRQLANWKEQILSGEAQFFKLWPSDERSPLAVAVRPFGFGQDRGYVLLLLPESNLLQSFAHFKLPLFILACTIALTGWSVIYMLTRRLSKPIREAAAAAKQIVAGNYKLQLNDEHKEKETYELMLAFKEMADRLHRLESLRTQLLAGVTHELKTPVASISGLLQALKDDVVSGPEKERFLEVCLADSRRLHKMVEDLLEFNSFAGNAVSVAKVPCDLKTVISEIAARWRHGQNQRSVQVHVETAANVASWRTNTDPNRLEQIIVNLLNNARDAMGAGGVITIRLSADAARFHIQVRDTGHGIPRDEQLDIFEPFYRGKQKKSRVRGLGIGLPLSRMIARSLGGDLVLTDSGPAGTTFTLLLPFA